MTPTLLGEAQRLAIYIGESDRWRGKPLYAAILEVLNKEKIAGATVVRGVAGFGAHSHIHTASILRLSEDLPLIIHVIDTPEKIQHALELISPMVREGLITVEDVQVIRYTHRYLNPLPADRLVEEVMTREVETLSPEQSVAEAWQKMLDTYIKAMPVVSEEGTVVGMLTDEDLLERAGIHQRLSVAEQLDDHLLAEEISQLQRSPLKVEDVMSKPAITVRAKDALGVAATRMAREGIKRLPVLDEKDRLVGVLSRVDILRLLAEKPISKAPTPPGAAKTLQEVMSPIIPAVQFDDDLATIVEKMLECASHRVIVLDQAGKAIGLISDSDVVARAQPRHRKGILAAFFRKASAPSSDVTAETLMSRGVLTAPLETPLVEAARAMMTARRKWLVVVDENEHPVGLVDRHILLKAITNL